MAFSVEIYLAFPELTRQIAAGKVDLMMAFQEDEEEYTASELQAIDGWLLQLAKIEVEQFMKSRRHE